MKYSYIVNSGTLQNFDVMKTYFLFSPLYAKTHREIQCVEGGATKCMYGHTFNLLYRDWMVGKLAYREPAPEEIQILNYLLALPPHCNTDLYPRAFGQWLARDKEFWNSSGILTTRPLTLNSNFERRPQSDHIWLTVTITKTHCSVKLRTYFFLALYFFLYIHFLRLSSSFLLCHN